MNSRTGDGYIFPCKNGVIFKKQSFLKVSLLVDSILFAWYSYTIALSGLFELYAREAAFKPRGAAEWLKARLERTIQINHD